MTSLPYAAENGVQLPIWMFWGTDEEWLIPCEPTHENETGLTVELWLKRNSKSDMIPADWTQCACTVNGRFKDHASTVRTRLPCSSRRWTTCRMLPCRKCRSASGKNFSVNSPAIDISSTTPLYISLIDKRPRFKLSFEARSLC